MTDKPKIRIAFNAHGLGDVVHCCHAMKLYQSRGYDVQVQIEPNKRWAWEAAGIPIHHGGGLPVHPYYYPDDFFNLSKPDYLQSKIAHLFEVAELPKLGTKSEVWQAICETEIDATHAVSSRAMDDAGKFLEGLPHPIILLHSKGTNWQEEKSIPDGIAFQLIRNLLETGGSVVTLDWDGRAPTLGHDRVRGIKPNWHHISLEEFGALCILADLFIGVDSGPFHLAGWFDIPTLYVSRKIPPVRCCLPSPMATYLVPAKDHEHWVARGPEWRFVEFIGTEATAAEISIAAAAILEGGLDRITVTAADLEPLGGIEPPPVVRNSRLSPDIPGKYLYRRVGHDERQMELLPNGKIGEGAGGCELAWKLERTPSGTVLSIYGHHGGATCHLTRADDGIYRGKWLAHEQMPIELIRLAERAGDQPSAPAIDQSPAYRFAVGIPTLNRYDLLERCLAACRASSVAPERIVIIDNGGGLPPGPDVVKPARNIGVAASWNMIHRLTQPLDLIILNDDIEPGHNMFERMLASPEQFVTADEAHMFEAFLIRQPVWDAVGEFDETFYPAYHEDNDYFMRLNRANVEIGCPQSNGYIENGPSATKARFNQDQINDFNAAFNAGRAYYVRKWGGPPHLETFTVPFNGQSPHAH